MNPDFEIVLHPSYLAAWHGQALRSALPLTRCGSGSSLWIRRAQPLGPE